MQSNQQITEDRQLQHSDSSQTGMHSFSSPHCPIHELPSKKHYCESEEENAVDTCHTN